MRHHRPLPGLPVQQHDLPFPLRDLRGLDDDLFEHCLVVLRLDASARSAIEGYFPEGGALFQKMISAWGLMPKPMQQLQPAREEYHAKYDSYGNAPGYRDMSLFFKVEIDGALSERIEFRLSAGDIAAIGRDNVDMQRFVWFRSDDRKPIDAKPGEQPPRWITGDLA